MIRHTPCAMLGSNASSACLRVGVDFDGEKVLNPHLLGRVHTPHTAE